MYGLLLVLGHLRIVVIDLNGNIKNSASPRIAKVAFVLVTFAYGMFDVVTDSQTACKVYIGSETDILLESLS